MIKNVTSNSPYIIVGNYNGSLGYISPGSQAGQVRYNTNMNVMEVFNGTAWQDIAGQADIDLSYDAKLVLEWGKKKMARELEMEALAKEHPTVAAALDALRKAEEQLDIVAILCKEEK